MKASTLVDTLIHIATQVKTLYVMGCFGAPLNAANKARYTINHAYNTNKDRTAKIKAADPDTFGFDCVCLIKAILWGWTGDASKPYGGAVYNSNGVPDLSADQMIKKCANVSTDFSKIVPGAAVHMNGHIGIYIGDGLAVECTPKWTDNVQVTAVGNIGPITGFQTRTWERWGLLPYVDYTADIPADVSECSEIVAEWACEAWEAAKAKGVTDGTRPTDPITRQEVIVMLHRLGLF